MQLLLIALGTAAVLLVAYFTYGQWVSRKLALRDDIPTPATEINDGVDFVPTPSGYLLSQHFSAIAAAGPIVGPIIAGLMFGWLPALLWIIVGSIFIGGVHDITSLIASVRHKARTIAEIVREHMSRRAYLLFLSFVWIALVYIVVAFTDITATTFAPAVSPDSADYASRIQEGGEVASASMLYLLLAVVMGLLLKFTRMSLNWAMIVFMPLVLLTILAGRWMPLVLPEWMHFQGSAAKTWDIILLVYCGVASVVPVWALLQPRGFLGGYFLTAVIVLATLGLFAGVITGRPVEINYPALRDPWWQGMEKGLPVLLFPMLFVTIACGACSGFHSMISSGTTSKQLRVETDARRIGYGAMLLEAFVAMIALSCVMVLKDGSEAAKGTPDAIFAQGISNFIAILASSLGIDFATASAYLKGFCLLAFATFIYDTLDVCTRLGRFVLQEFTGWQGNAGRIVCTVVTLLPSLFLVLQTLTATNPNGVQVPIPAWKVFWTLFGTANQLLAALTLTGITVWLWKTGKTWWYTAIPAVFMLAVTLTSLGKICWNWYQKIGMPGGKDLGNLLNGTLSLVLLVLGGLLVIDACWTIANGIRLKAAASAR